MTLSGYISAFLGFIGLRKDAKNSSKKIKRKLLVCTGKGRVNIYSKFKLNSSGMVLTVLHALPSDGALFSMLFLQLVLTVLHAPPTDGAHRLHVPPTVGAHRSPCSSYRRCSLFADNICFCFVFYHVKSLEVYQEENS